MCSVDNLSCRYLEECIIQGFLNYDDYNVFRALKSIRKKKSCNFLGKTIGDKLSIKVYKLGRCFDSLIIMNKVPVIVDTENHA